MTRRPVKFSASELAVPQAIIGAMMFLVGVELLKFLRGVTSRSGLLVTGATIVVSIAGNMAIGFLCGLVVSGAVKRFSGRVKTA